MIQIKHQNPDASSDFIRCTFAIELFDKDLLLSLVQQGKAYVPVNLGVSYVHPKDAYVKKVGREQATNRIVQRDAMLTRVEMRRQRVVFHFRTFVIRPNFQSQYVEFGISYIPDSPNTRLEYIFM